MEWGMYALVVIGLLCWYLYDWLTAREQRQRQRYYWNKRDEQLGIRWNKTGELNEGGGR